MRRYRGEAAGRPAGAVRVCCFAALGLVAGMIPVAAERNKPRLRGEMVNVFLAPGNAQWLIGPIGWMANEEEVEAFLEITDDEIAGRFIEGFWARREPVPGSEGLTARQQFEQRAEEADLLYGESTFPGRRTDRGTIFILYGPPDEVKHEPVRPARRGRYRARPVSAGKAQVERWLYARGRIGLDGRSPRRAYEFIRVGDLTRFVDPSRLP